MASTGNVVWCAAVALVVWTSLGYALLCRLVPSRSSALALAPIAGWAVNGALAVPIFYVVPFTAASVATVYGACLVGAFWLARQRPRVASNAAAPRADVVQRTPWPWAVAVVLAALLAAGTAVAILPKHVGDAVVLADPIFDHAKVSLVDDIARVGMPPGNPYLAIDTGPPHLAYYYLWHFSAAELSRVLHVSGWEADAAMTFFSAFTSLLVMMGLAVRLAGRASAAVWVVVAAASSSMRFMLVALFGEPGLDRWIRNPGGFAGWLFQSAWVPQHIASTSCVLLSLWLMTRLAAGRGLLSACTVLVTGIVVAAGFESSTWIGGVVFAIAALAFVPMLVWRTARDDRGRLLIALSITAVVAAVVASPFLHDQLASAAQRGRGSPIAFDWFPVTGEVLPATWRRVLDLPAYWLVLLQTEMIGIYLPGLAAMAWLARRASRSPQVADDADGSLRVVAFATLGVAALGVAWLLRSTLADNNDLAWRAGLLASTVLIAFTAAGMASWVAGRRWIAVAATGIALAFGLPEAARMIVRNATGDPQPQGRAFAADPDLWRAVRAHSGPLDRVANDPATRAHLTPWPVNIGWSLLADRRSCNASWELTQVYTALPHPRLRALDAQFERVFAGGGTADDAKQFATVYGCDVVVVTPEDGAWKHDPFAASDDYQLVDERPDRWRIYHRRG